MNQIPKEPRYEDGPQRLLAGLNQHYTYKTIGEIPALWQKFAPHINHTQQQVDEVCYGVLHKSDDSGFEYMAAVEVSTADGLPEDLTTFSIPAQRYAVFTHEGHVSQLSATIDYIYHEWLPKADVEPTREPDFYERYGPAFDPHAGQGDVELWIPITPKDK